MVNSISSQPGANRFRSLLVMILVLICIVIFLGYSQYLTQQTDRVARDRVISEVRQALAMMLYDYAVKGKLQQLQRFDRENPFTLMAAYRPVPKAYLGTLVDEPAKLSAGWYYDLSRRQVIWQARDGERQHFVLRLDYQDGNHNGRFDAGREELIGLDIKKASE